MRKIKKATALDRIGCPYWGTMSGDIIVGMVVGMLIDHNRAFDAIPHEIKMKCYGIRGVEYACVRSYLKNRKQFVKMGESLSSCVDTVYGVPQGSVLGQRYSSYTSIIYSRHHI